MHSGIMRKKKLPPLQVVTRLTLGNTISYRIAGADMHSDKMWKKTGAADVVTE